LPGDLPRVVALSSSWHHNDVVRVVASCWMGEAGLGPPSVGLGVRWLVDQGVPTGPGGRSDRWGGANRAAEPLVAGKGDGVVRHRDGVVLGRLLRGRARPADRRLVVVVEVVRVVVSASKSAIFQARARLGAEPVRELFVRVARPLATPDAPGSWLVGRRLMAIDGTCLDVADNEENASFFGRPGVSNGEQAAFPQACVVALAECGTHSIFDAVVGPYTTSEIELSRQLVGRLQPGMVLLADRGFYGFRLWQQAFSTGADLLWRVKSNLKPHHSETLPDGSWLAEVTLTGKRGTEGIAVGGAGGRLQHRRWSR